MKAIAVGPVSRELIASFPASVAARFISRFLTTWYVTFCWRRLRRIAPSSETLRPRYSETIIAELDRASSVSSAMVSRLASVGMCTSRSRWPRLGRGFSAPDTVAHSRCATAGPDQPADPDLARRLRLLGARFGIAAFALEETQRVSRRGSCGGPIASSSRGVLAPKRRNPCDGFRQQGRTHPRGWRLVPCLGMGSSGGSRLTLAIASQSRSASTPGQRPRRRRLSPRGPMLSAAVRLIQLGGGGPSLDSHVAGSIYVAAAEPHMLGARGAAVAATTQRQSPGRPGCRCGSQVPWSE